ncbi:MAG: TonB-dependent receptor plug domain-containing protein [Gemmatimonadaceae bacterium]|nr:TonB-dependent receptor plug domain-containing protein [Gemmatimonadaceae bacterium]
MDAVLIRRSLRTATALAALAFFASAAQAQTQVFAGKVTSAGQPVGGASVGIPEIGAGTITTTDGKYSFTVDVAKYGGRNVNLVVRYIGLKPKRLPMVIAAGRVDKDYDLEKDILNLEQVVVTGVSDATSQKKTAFAVAVVDATAIKEAPAISPIGSLAGKIAGASVATTSGSPGSEPAIRLRSATSLAGRQDPLVIIDGTITRLGLADVNSQDIERVEVIKGAAASSLYGSDAANGVIQIFTKRGANLAEGQTNFTFRNEYGQSYLPRKVGLNNSTAFELDPTNTTGLLKGFKLDANGQRIAALDDISDNSYPFIYDALSEVFKPGSTMSNYISLGHRKGATNFNASIQNIQETGVLTLLKGYSRQNFRINVDQAVNDKLNVSTGMFYGRSRADQTNEGGLFFGIRFLEPNVDITAPNPDGTPYLAKIRQPPSSGNLSNPLYTLNNQQVQNDRDRFTGVLKATYRPLEWLTAEGNFNYDQSTGNNKSFTPIGFQNSIGGKGQGGLSQGYTSDHTFNTGATLTAIRSLGDWLTNTTKLAMVYEDQTANSLGVSASKLTVGGVTEFGAAAQDPECAQHPGLEHHHHPESQPVRDHHVRHQGSLHHRRSRASGRVVAVRRQGTQGHLHARLGRLPVQRRLQPSRHRRGQDSRVVRHRRPASAVRCAVRGVLGGGWQPVQGDAGQSEPEAGVLEGNGSGFQPQLPEELHVRVQLLRQGHQRPDPAGTDVVGHGLSEHVGECGHAGRHHARVRVRRGPRLQQGLLLAPQRDR